MQMGVGFPNQSHTGIFIGFDSGGNANQCLFVDGTTGSPGAGSPSGIVGLGYSVGVAGRVQTGTTLNTGFGVQGDVTNGGTGFGYGAYGVADEGAGVYGQQSNEIAGSVGVNKGAYGVLGTSHANWGVLGTSDNVAGVAGSSTNWTGGWFAGPTAQIELVPNGVLGAPVGGQHYRGMIFVDSTVTMWLCTGTGTPGTWVRMATVANGTLGGAVHLLPVATRLLDTRGGSPVASHGTAQFNAGGVGGIPTNAAAVFGHVAAALRPGVNPGDGSSAILWPAGQTRPGAVNIVYNGGDLQGEYTGTLALVAIGASGQISLYSQPILPVGVDYLFDAFGFVL
jgi:hypothetical protein